MSFRVVDGKIVPEYPLQEECKIPGCRCHEQPQFYRPGNAPVSVGIGGAPNRVSILPDDSKERKKYPVATGFMDYFPDAIVAVSNVSYVGNEQHNAGKPVHWDRSKSGDETDTMMRHFLARGTLDKDGVRHSAKLVWRACALLQKEIEEERKRQ